MIQSLAVAQVILHVAAAEVQLGVDVGEFAEDLLRALAHDVGQHVQPAAVGHGQHDFANALVAGLFDGQVQQRDQAFGPFQREAFGAGNRFWMNSSKIAASVSRVRMRNCSLRLSVQPVLGAFHPVLQPLPHVQIVDVHELHADRAAVGVAQPLQNVAAA